VLQQTNANASQPKDKDATNIQLPDNSCNGKEKGGDGKGKVPAGQINQRIYNSARGAYGQSTASGPAGGNEACAWQVNRVLAQSGIAPIGSNPDYVPSVESALQGGRGSAISPNQAQAGDIVIAGGQQHIGICMNNGCSQVLSNSSSRAAFVWKSDRNFDGFYGGGASRIYRVRN